MTKPFQIAKIAPTKPPEVVLPPLALKARVEMQKRLPTLASAVEALTVTTPAEYQEADGLLGMVQEARRSWAAKFEPVIRPIRQGLDALYALVREPDQVLAGYEAAIKGKQKKYKLEEARQARELADQQAAEQARIQAELDRVAQKAETATGSTKTRLQARREALEAESEQVAAEEVIPVRAAHSTTRTVKKWRVTDIKIVVAGVKAKVIPPEVLTIDTRAVEEVFKSDSETVASWPGFELFDDITIVGRR